MAKQQGQGHFPTTPPGNKSAGPSGTQTPAQKIARQSGADPQFGSRGGDALTSPKVFPNG